MVYRLSSPNREARYHHNLLRKSNTLKLLSHIIVFFWWWGFSQNLGISWNLSTLFDEGGRLTIEISYKAVALKFQILDQIGILVKAFLIGEAFWLFNDPYHLLYHWIHFFRSLLMYSKQGNSFHHYDSSRSYNSSAARSLARNLEPFLAGKQAKTAILVSSLLTCKVCQIYSRKIEPL